MRLVNLDHPAVSEALREMKTRARSASAAEQQSAVLRRESQCGRHCIRLASRVASGAQEPPRRARV